MKVSQKIKDRTNIVIQQHFWVFMWKNKNTNSKLHMFITALFTITKIWKQPKCPSRTKKMWYIYTMEYYSAIKKNEFLPWATTWMGLEGIMLSEISQTEKHKYHMISLIHEIWRTIWTNKQNRRRFRCREQSRASQIGGGLGGWVKKMKGLRSTKWQLQNSHRM